MRAPERLLADTPERLVETALELVSFDTANPPGETADLVDVIERFFTDLGLEVDRVTVDPAKPNLLATLPGAGPDTLCFNGHLDTVPFDGSQWTHDPLGERDGDRIYGRGATDMKGPLASMLHTARAFVETDTTPPVTVRFALVSDEEVGGDVGLPAVLDSGRFGADACVIGETTCEGGRHSVTVADRGSIWLTLEATGEASHGSRPMLGENAIDRLYVAIERIRSIVGQRTPVLPTSVEPIVEESVAYYEAIMGADAARALFTTPTINLGTIHGGEAINTVPESARARLDIRTPPGVAPETILEDLRDCVDSCEGIVIADVSWSTGSYDAIDSPIVEAVASVAAAVTGERIYRRSGTGGGDAKAARRAGIETVEFALGTETAHAVDEYTTLDALRLNAQIYARLPWVYADLRGR